MVRGALCVVVAGGVKHSPFFIFVSSHFFFFFFFFLGSPPCLRARLWFSFIDFAGKYQVRAYLVAPCPIMLVFSRINTFCGAIMIPARTRRLVRQEYATRTCRRHVNLATGTCRRHANAQAVGALGTRGITKQRSR